MSELIVIRPAGELQIDGLLNGLAEDTRRAYAHDLKRFAAARGEIDAREAVLQLIESGAGQAHQAVHQWRGDMLAAGKSPATINRALSSLRSVMKLARQFGFCNWTLEVDGVPSQKYRDTRGPGTPAVVLALQLVSKQPAKVAARDTALIRLLFDVALRRKEVAGLNLHDLQLATRRLSIRGKGRRENEFVTLPVQTSEAIGVWLEHRGDEPGPLFYSFDPRSDGKARLAGDGIYRVLKEYGAQLGTPLRPHGLRHSAITEALDQTNGNMRSVKRFSRHRNTATLEIYDDNRTDMGGEIAGGVADSVKGTSECE